MDRETPSTRPRRGAAKAAPEETVIGKRARKQEADADHQEQLSKKTTPNGKKKKVESAGKPKRAGAGAGKLGKKTLPQLLPEERESVVKQLEKHLKRLRSPPSTAPVPDLVEEYLAFMTLKQRRPGVLLSPSLAIDDVWHCHILCTEAYKLFCDRHFGDFIHHDPDLFPVGLYHDTLRAYEEEFEKTPPKLCWPDPPIPPLGSDPADEDASGSGEGDNAAGSDGNGLEEDQEGDVYTMEDIEGDFGKHMSRMRYNPMQFLGQRKGSVFTGCG